MCSVNHYSPALARFNTKVLAWVFVPFDIISLALQGVGGSLSAASTGSSQVGVDLAMAGLILQIVTLFAFSAYFADFMVRFLRSCRSVSLQPRDKLFFSFLA